MEAGVKVKEAELDFLAELLTKACQNAGEHDIDCEICLLRL